METYERECCVRGYHVYKDTWEAAIGEQLECVREQSNAVDWYAVAVLKDDTIVGPLYTEDVSAHLLDVLEKRWCDTVSRCRKEKVFRLASRYKISADKFSPPQVLGE